MFSEKFICAGYDYTTYTFHVPAPYFRKAFEIDGEVKKCVITLTGLGFYELYVNGQRLTKGIWPRISRTPTILSITTNMI